MKRKIQKTFAILLLLSMVVTLLPNTVFAAATDQENTEPTQNPDENINPDVEAYSLEEPTAKEKVLDATSGSNYQITMSVYLLYSNTLPTKDGELDIDKGFSASEFGPSGDDTSYFTVTVDLQKLLGKKGMDAKYNADGSWYISVATCAELAENLDTRLATFWDNVLDCMSAEDKAKFTSNFGGNYKGYVVKHESGDHIDGILVQDPDVYLTEIFGADENHSLVASHSETGKKTNLFTIKQDVLEYCKGYLGDNLLSISKTQISEDRKTVQLTLSNKVLGNENYGMEYVVTFTGNQLSEVSHSWEPVYPAYDLKVDHFFVASYSITLIEQTTTKLVITKVWDDENNASQKQEDFVWVSVNVGNGLWKEDKKIQLRDDNNWTTEVIVPVSMEDNFYIVKELNYAQNTPEDKDNKNYTYSVSYTKPEVVNGLVTINPTATVTNTCITNTGKLTITKTFNGLDETVYTAIKENGFSIILTGSINKTPIILTLDQAELNEESKTYTWTLNSITTGTYQIAESNADFQDYTRTTDYSFNGSTNTPLNGAEVSIKYNADNQLVITNNYEYVEPEKKEDAEVTPNPDETVPSPDVPGTGDDTNIDDPQTPTTDVPDTGDDTNIDDPQTPNTNTPDTTDQNQNGTTDLVDDETPMSNAPKTGDPFILWGLLAAASASGLAGYTFKKKKDHDKE